MILEAKNIRKEYRTGPSGVLPVLNGIDLSVAEGEIIAVAGPSGAGKSTLVHILGLLDRPTSGELTFEGRSVPAMTDDELSTVRNSRIGFVFQFHHLLPEFTALENVMMPALIAGRTASEAAPRAEQLLADVGISARAGHTPSELSGGEQQRVAVARALMNEPAVIFADEPSGNLDSENADRLHDLLFFLRERHGRSFVIVTHNKDLAARADRLITIVDGKIV